MKNNFQGWPVVTELLRELVTQEQVELNAGQKAALLAIADRIEHHGIILADEVGMGKTRIAAALSRCVIAAGGRVAVLIPGGLAANWREELKTVGVTPSAPLLSLKQYMSVWETDIPSAPWFEENCLIVSHSMANWRLGEKNNNPQRWGLLPELCWRWSEKCDCPSLTEPHLKLAAKKISAAIRRLPAAHPARKQIKSLTRKIDWDKALSDKDFGVYSTQREHLETSVGLGLGTFELVIVDEAHKSRGQSSSLNRLLENIIQPASETRRLAVSATPIELDSQQWTQMLARIEVSSPEAIQAIEHYQAAVADIRENYANSLSQQKYYQASAAFEQALSPYLLRRDKREDESVQKFHQHSTRPYRRKKEIVVDTFSLPMSWRQAICAAEALSFVSRMHEDSAAQRLRLTVGNGHGIATLLNAPEENVMPPFETDQQEVTEPGTRAHADKRQQRAKWWQSQLTPILSTGEETPLFTHPAILAAVEAVEEVCSRDEKVLVFGRLTRPMTALVQLLNAREMLRTLESKQNYWPHEQLPVSEWPAVQCAWRQLYDGEASQKDINAQLASQYKELDNSRIAFRNSLILRLDEGLSTCESHSVKTLFNVFKQRAPRRDGNEDLVIVARAIYSLTGTAEERRSPARLADVFTDIVNATRDRDNPDSDEEVDGESQFAEQRWQVVVDWLHEEYSRRESDYARLMNGQTSAASRNLINLAFNRQYSRPSVLVAQSLVAREGLNLHLACKTVIMLHPEWNPGVVEQQIGRVDRLNSLWQKKLEEALNAGERGDALPTIDFMPVIFKGTYDERNWQVLNQRWDNLRAQLHGNPFSVNTLQDNVGNRENMQSVIDAAPNFSPLNQNRRPSLSD
ncbi:DEAD/DEAH box helicase [Rahnella sp. CFA14(1/10)]|uniref:DEAD/DEAH box helicase n=1 Tax=Rahnella sp. CFA14(1/10) TaxID=2511203 RepID=UPI00101FF72A|nr:SNF2-related protein [Rahnella sp. CFA14(1/10)]